MKRVMWIVGLSFGLSLAAARHSDAQDSVPTFAKDVAPILFTKCISCHRPGEVAPMSLLTYEQVRPWSKAIKQKTATREMPPWGPDPKFGKFANDMSLSESQIKVIAAWVDGGAPRGNPADMPTAPPVVTGWTYGEPDYVISMMGPYHVPPEGEMPNISFYSPIPFKEDRFARLLEWRPGNRSAIHHGTASAVELPAAGKLNEVGEFIYEDGTKENDIQIGRLQRSQRALQNAVQGLRQGAGRAGIRLTDYVPGRTAMPVSDPNVGQRLPAGRFVHWGMHYQPTGKPETDQSRLGIWFTNKSKVQELYRRQVGDPLPTSADKTGFFRVQGVDLPHNTRFVREELGWPNLEPNVDNFAVMSVTAITEPITLYGFTPHMHLRGKDKAWFLTLPDGKEQTLLSIPHYDFNWQNYYELAEPLKIPAGSAISTVAHYNNTATNKYNPAPEKEVFWSEQSWDEMYCPFIVYTVDSETLKDGQPTTPSIGTGAAPRGQAKQR
jgi:hypothetical protein